MSSLNEAKNGNLNILKISKNKCKNHKPQTENQDTNKASILSLLKNKNRSRTSIKTEDTNIFKSPKLDYDLNEIKKFDELNNSLSSYI